MKKLLLFTFSMLISSSFYAQTSNSWKSATKNDVKKVNKNVERQSFPQEFKLFQGNVETLKQLLQSSPDRFVAKKSNTIISLPNVNGEMERYEFFEASNFDSDLQAQYPSIRSYVGIGIDDKFAQVRLSVDQNGIQAMIFRAGKNNEFIEPYSKDGSVYAVYNSSRVKGNLPFTCSTVDHEIISGIQLTPNALKSDNGVLKTFRLAMSCTAEYANYFGATSAAQSGLVLAAYNATMTRVNGVFEKDLAIHMNITANSVNVIYYNPITDPYSPASTGAGGAWNGELQTTLTNMLGTTTYDIGHLFGATGGGGNAGCIGCVCSTDGSKGSGYTSPADGIPTGDNFDIDYVAHEMGHQLGANHTFSMGTENNSVNVEPGSGSTIMGYAGITGATDVQPHSDDYFTYRSILQIQTNLLSKTCTTNTAITHGTPVVNAGSDWTIPKSTPFILTGSATDSGGNPLTYCWEQNNDATSPGLGATNSLVSPTKTNGPNWRSRNPETVPYRYMPKLSSVLNNTLTADWESVNSVARVMTFSLMARDNVAGGGQTGVDEMLLTVSATTGPFDVTSQNTDQIVWAQGSSQTITWTVNGTTSLVGSTNVDILLSTDGGQTFTTTLASNVPNNGSYVITVPSINAAYCRVMVKPTGNIYYDINTKNIAIGNVAYQLQDVCTDYPFNLNAAITESSDNSYPGMSLTVPDSFVITDANFYANVTHPNIGQFSLLIKAPWQTSLNTALWYGNTCTTANMDKWFDTAGTAVNCASVTSGGPFLPYSTTNINGYNGNNSAGSWLIYFKDTVVDSNVANALFNSFTIQLCKSEYVPVLLSNESFGLTDFALYPNPNNGNFTVQFSSETGNDVNIMVHDLRGRQVYTKSFQNNGLFNQELQLNNTASGIYLVTVQDGNRKEVKKIVVE
ncbi:reprolysin-like metallopeptidase [Flavobacterium ponti]|uniref:Reprolysin-like metallopeptidase n=1 Tax=Flavobacterium ponti TaxID=665133 RepID=A0ABV9NZ46_9FLAO